MEVIYSIEGDKSEIKIPPCKIKRPNVEIVSIIKRGKCPEVIVAKYGHYLRDGQMTRAGKQYMRIQFSVTPNAV